MTDDRVMLIHWGTRLFDVPVYRLSPAQFRAEQDRRYETIFDLAWGRFPDEATDRSRASIRNLVWREAGTYEFNQVMGWVHVLWDGPGPVIKCYYTRVAARRVTRSFRQRRFEDFGKIAEEWISPSATSAEIAAQVRTALVAETRGRHGSLRGRFLDLEVFDNLAPVLDLRTLMGLGQRPTRPVRFVAADPEDDNQC